MPNKNSGNNSQNYSSTMSRDDYKSAIYNNSQNVNELNKFGTNYSDANWAVKALGTWSNFNRNITTGVANFVEGTVDATAALWSVITGGNADDFIAKHWADNVGEFIDKVGYFDPIEIIGDQIIGDRLEKYSITKNNNIGEMVEQGELAVGEMLPSIVIGIFGGQAASVSSMAVAAGGHAMEEALNEGANTYQAFGYANLVGGTEAATELVVGKILGFIGLGEGKVMGVIGKGSSKAATETAGKTASQITKKSVFNTIKSLIKSANEEGTEEVVSDLLNPLYKKIYNKDISWWDETFGTEEGRESLLKSYILGASIGVLFGSVSDVVKINKYGLKGTALMEQVSNRQTLLEEFTKKNNNGKLTDADLNNFAKQFEIYDNNIQTLVKDIQSTQQGSKYLQNLQHDVGNIMTEMSKSTTLTENENGGLTYDGQQGNYDDSRFGGQYANDSTRISSQENVARTNGSIETSQNEFEEQITRNGIETTIQNVDNHSINVVDSAYIEKNYAKISNFVKSHNLKLKVYSNALLDVDNKEIRGFTKGMTVYINGNSINSMEVASHEVLHHKITPYYVNQVVESMKKNGIYQNAYNEYRQSLSDLSEYRLQEEMAVDFLTIFDGFETSNDLFKDLRDEILGLESKRLNKIRYNKEITNTDVNNSNQNVESVENAEKPLQTENNNSNLESSEGVEEDEFRRLQEESRRILNQRSWGKESKGTNEDLRTRLQRTLRKEIQRRGYGNSNTNGLLKLEYNGNVFEVHENVDGQTFHDIFEIARADLNYGELVDLHDVKTTEDGIGYEDCTNYLSTDGLSGFSITPDGDLISVFNVGTKRGWLRSIKPIIDEKVNTLDCFISPKQNLMKIYSNIFGFKTASIMDHNMDYDHDYIAETHNNPKVAFMVKTTQDVETKNFDKNDYDGAVNYRNSFLENSNNTETVERENLLSKIEKVKYFENIRSWKLLDKMSLKDLKAFEKMTSGNLSYEELMDLDITKYAEDYVKNHKQLQADENKELVQKVKEEFKKEILKGKENLNNKQRKALVITGLPSAGKSSGNLKAFMKKYNAVEFDNDIAKGVPSLAQYYEGGLGANTVQEIVSVAQKELFNELLNEGYNIVYPAVGKNIDKLSLEFGIFNDNGYSVELEYIDVLEETAFNRALKRFVDTGRYVSLKYIKSVGYKPRAVFQQIQNQGGTINYATRINENGNERIENKTFKLSGYQEIINDADSRKGDTITQNSQTQSSNSLLQDSGNGLQREGIGRTTNESRDGGRSNSNESNRNLTEATIENNFTSLKNTEDIVNNMLSWLQLKLGDNKTIRITRSKSSFTNETFDKLGKFKSQTAAKKIADEIFNNFQVETFDSTTNKFSNKVAIGTELTTADKASFESVIKDLIDNSMDINVKTDLQPLRRQIEKLRKQVADRTNRINLTRKIQKAIITLPNDINAVYEINDDSLTNHTASLLLKPFINMKVSDIGYTAQGKTITENGVKIKLPDLVSSIDTLLESYNETNEKLDITKNENVFMPYDQRIADKLIAIRNSIGEPIELFTNAKDANGNVIMENGKPKRVSTGEYRYESLNANTLDLIYDYLKTVKEEHQKAILRNARVYQPQARQTIETIKKRWDKNKPIRNLLSKPVNVIAPAYIVNRSALGNSVLSDYITTGTQVALSNKIMFTGGYSDIVNQKHKQLGIRKKLGKRVNFNNVSIQYDSLVDLYNHLHTQTNFDAINENGFKITEKGKVIELIKPNEATQALESIEKVLPKEMIEYADFVKGLYNNELRQDYIKWYRDKYNQEPNELAKKDYYPLYRQYDKLTNVEKAMQGIPLFRNSISRVTNKLAIRSVSATNGLTAYVNELARQKYLIPTYTDIIKTINTNVDGENVAGVIKAKAGTKYLNYIKKTLDSYLGITQYQDGIINYLTSGYTIAKLGLNIGTTLKQFQSIWTSNIPWYKTVGGIFSTLSKNNRVLFNKIVNEIGSLKYRESSAAVVRANISSEGLRGIQQFNESYALWGMTKMDKLTMSTGVFTLMTIAKQNGYTTDAEIIEFVKTHYTEFELSQIGSNSNSQNAISRGDYGSLTRGIFGFMQGANVAATGSFINKLSTFRDNVGKNETEINERYEKLKKQSSELNEEIKKLQSDMEKVEKDETLSADESKEKLKDLRNQLTEKLKQSTEVESDFQQARLDKEYYARYKLMGGKGIIFNTAAGLVTSAIFITLINDLIKKIKGDRDWDEWNIKTLGNELLLNATLNWIPVVGTISNSVFNDYDLTVPSARVIQDGIDMLNNAIELFKNPTSGNIKALINDLIEFACNITGMPFANVYSYIKGIVGTFNPKAAIELNNIFYTTTPGTVTTEYKEQLDKGHDKKANALLEYKFEKFVGSKPSSSVINEFTRLVKSGDLTTLPNNISNSIVIDGKVVKLSEKDRKALLNDYQRANEVMDAVINSTEYRRLNDESKAALISMLYRSHYEMAKENHFENYISDSNYSFIANPKLSTAKSAKLFTALAKIRSIEATKTATKKELVQKYINSLSLSKDEKYLLWKLSGYQLSDDQNKQVRSYLKKYGYTKSQIDEIVK